MQHRNIWMRQWASFVLLCLTTSLYTFALNQQQEDIESYYKNNPVVVEKEVEVPVYVYAETEVEQEPEIVEQVVETAIEEPAYSVTPEERDLIAKILWLEGRGEEEWCQKQIVSVIMNRTIKYGSIEDVIYAPKQFTTAKMVGRAHPTEETYAIVDDVIQNGSVLPWYVMFFRADRHATWKGYRPYNTIGNTYFGYSTADYNG